MRKRWLVTALGVLALAAAFIWLTGSRASTFGVATAAADDTRATARATMVDGREVGEVLVDNKVVMRIRTAAGGYSPFERAAKVAQRLDAALKTDLKPGDIHSAPFGSEAVVLGDHALLVTADAEHAHLNNSSSMGLAQDWATNLAGALGGQPGEPHMAQVGDTPAAVQPEIKEWVPPEPYTDKIVPILSIGEGKHIGAARVSGPSSKVDLVQAVAQGETHFREVVEINAYIPISTKEPGKRLSRVQDCAVTALGDLEF